ncbi:MAG TPA: YCF48-related protein, partial [Candidatus Angelobacter sp.]
MRGFTVLLACFLFVLPASAQWQQQLSGTDVQLRGVSAVSERIAWVSGAKGTVLRTIDGGEHWTKVDVPGAEALDFRDIQAFDWDTAFVLSIGPGEQSRIYKTTDGGKTWQLQFTNKDPKAFYDCFAFWDS